MRIGLCVEHFDPHRGGLEHWAWQFAREMIERGHEFHVLAQSFAGTEEIPSLRCHPMPRCHSRKAYAVALEKRLEMLDLDVVHDTGAGWRCDIYQPHFGSRAALIRRTVGILPKPLRPVKSLAIRLLPRYRRFAALEARQFVNDGRLFLALSRKVADSFVRYHGIHPESIRIVPNGIDCDRYRPGQHDVCRTSLRRELGLESDSLLLLMIAHNFRLKGLAAAIRVLSEARRSGCPVHLAVLGGGPSNRYRLLARSLNVSEHVTFLGTRPDSAPLLAAADALIHPTYYDACSLVVLEALASGLPVVSTRATGVDELMTDGVEGFLVADPSETSAMASHVQSLLDRTVRERMGRAARQLALRHTFARSCDAIEAAYVEIVARRGRTRHAA